MLRVGYPWGDDFAVAAARATADGWRGCPTEYLDGWYREHCGFDQLCSEFGCDVCRGDPTDEWFVGCDAWVRTGEADESEWEIDF